MKRAWLKQLRKARGITQSAAAWELGISVSLYAKLEEGLHEPKVATAKKLAEKWKFDWTRFYEE